ncbi:hypothetical protein D3C81_1917500 [compost metagenome]
MHLHELGIDADRRASGRQAEHGFGIALQQTDNQVRTGLYEIFFTAEFQNVH